MPSHDTIGASAILHTEQAAFVPIQAINSSKGVGFARIYFLGSIGAQIDANHTKDVCDIEQTFIAGDGDSVGIEEGGEKR